MIDIKGKDKAKILMALFNRAKPLAMSYIDYRPGDMSYEEAKQIIDSPEPNDFDYVQGRVIKVSLDGDSFNPFFYDRDHGQGAAAKAISNVD